MADLYDQTNNFKKLQNKLSLILGPIIMFILKLKTNDDNQKICTNIITQLPINNYMVYSDKAPR